MVKKLNQHSSILICLLLFGIAVTVRSLFYSSNLFFGFEQGRDALAVQQILQNHDFVLVGPKTDLGGIFHGAWYYYLMVLPYGISQGSPIVAGYFLILFSSFVPCILYVLFRKMGLDRKWSFFGAVLSSFSYHLVISSRWLSNVTPALTLSTLAWYFLWTGITEKKQSSFVLFSFFYICAAQFEILLTLFFPFILVLALLWSKVKPSKKTVILIFASAFFWFAPMILFNLRNDFISFRSLSSYTADASSSLSHFLASVITATFRVNWDIFQKTIFSPTNSLISSLFLLVSILGIFVLLKKSQAYTNAVIFFAFWFTSAWPVWLLPNMSGLVHLYVASVVPLIGLVTLGIYGLISFNRKSKYLMFPITLLLCMQLSSVFNLLQSNTSVFFRTIQDDLNLHDQREALSFIHQTNDPYTLVAYTIPYYQPEGWRYLNSYYYPQSPAEDKARLVYVVIEEKVDPYWEETWTAELGSTSLVEEKHFGLIRVQKRLADSKD